MQRKILACLEKESSPLSTRQLCLKTGFSWNTVQQHCLKLCLQSKIQKIEASGFYLWIIVPEKETIEKEWDKAFTQIWNDEVKQRMNHLENELYVLRKMFPSEISSKSKKIQKNILPILLLFGLFFFFLPFAAAAPINATTVDGLLVYGNGSVKNLFYRTWNDSVKNFTVQTNDTALTSNVVDWVDVKANHERDEFIAVTQDDARKHYARVYNASAETWGNTINLDGNLNGPDTVATRSVSVEYEDISGRALIVYENGGLNVADNKFGYVTWNGTGYSNEVNVTILESDELWKLELYPKAGTNHIMLLMWTEGSNLSSMLWNSTDFVNSTFIQNFTGSSISTGNYFSFSWESQSGDGLVVYANASASFSSMEFNATTGSWNANQSFIIGAVPKYIKICGDPTSNYISMLSKDGSSDTNSNVWNGSAWYVGGLPVEDATTTAFEHTSMSCTWETSGEISLLTYIDSTPLNNTYYNNFSKSPDKWWKNISNAPKTVALTVGTINYVHAIANPVTDEIMFAVKEDRAATGKINAHLWNGTQWQNITEPLTYLSTTMCNQGYDCVGFDWSRYDPNPNVSGLAVNTSALNNLNENINITVNVTDNLNIDTVGVNITKPDATIVQANLTNVGQVFNLTFSSTDVRGTYTVLIIANDTSKHQNINATETLTFTAGDVTTPAVTNLAVNNTAPPQNELVNISVNVTDATNVDVVLVNVTIPGLSLFDQYRMTNISGALPKTFNLTFANTSRAGTYTIRIIANDTFNNINDTQTITFAVGDTTRPVVTQLAVNQTSLLPDQTLNFTVNVTDNVAVDVVLVNVTIPGLSVFDQYRMTNISSALPATFNLTFANTSRVGTYMIRVIANDTVNNINSTQTINFSVGDVTRPAIALNAPVDVFNTSNPNITFQFTPTDDMNTTVFANITVDSVVNVSNSSAVNNTLTTLQGIGFAEGNHSWNVTASDGTGNQNTSTIRRFVVDQSIPNFHTLTNVPSSAADVDPGVRLAFFGHVSDNFTAPHVVYLQHKLSTDADFTNVTATYNSSNNRYEAGFTPSSAGTYTVRLFANDTVNNRGVSTEINISVQTDATWTRSPASVAVGAAAAVNKSFVNITLTNTGDAARNFTITSTFQNTTFNTTFPLELAVNEARIVEVNVTSPRTTGGYSFQLEINATPNGDPANSNVSATLAVTEGQPFLAATITEIPTSATKGNSIRIIGQVQNIGTGNASNGTYFFTVPSGWDLVGGSLNTTFTELLVNDKLTNTINFEISTTANDDLQTVMINATGVNDSGADLVPLNLTSGDVQTINITNATTQVLGGTEISGAGAPGGAAGGAAGGAGAPGINVGQTKLSTSSSAGDLRTDRSTTEILETQEIIYVIRGNTTQFPFNVTNIFNNSAMRDVNLSIDGYLAKYMSWVPEKISTILHNETGQFFITIAAPSYKKREEHNLTFIITSTVYAKYIDFIFNNETDVIDTHVKQVKTKVIEKRNVTLVIIEASPETAEEKVQYAERMLAAFEEKNLPTQKLASLVKQIKEAYAGVEYGKVQKLYETIQTLATQALEAKDILEESKEKYQLGKERGYAVGPLEVLISLTESALSREDFESAYRRAKVMELYQLIAIEQRFDLSDFFAENWGKLLFFFAGIALWGYFAYKRAFLRQVDATLADLTKEEKEIEHLKEEAQKLCYEEKKISMVAFHKQMHHYEDRLATIERKKQELEQKKEFLLTKEQVLASLKKEREKIISLIKQTETMYFILSSISKREFLQNLDVYKTRLVEIEKNIGVLEAKVEKEAKVREIVQQRLRQMPLKTVLKELLHKNTILAFQYLHDLSLYYYFILKNYSKHLSSLVNYVKKQRLALHVIGAFLILGIVFAISFIPLASVPISQFSLTGPVTGFAIAPVNETALQQETTALQQRLRMKEEQFYRELGEEERFKLGEFLEEYWHFLLLVFTAAAILSYSIHRRIFLANADATIENLKREEQEIDRLKLEAQKLCFQDRQISLLIYHRRMYKYAERIALIQRKIFEVERKKHLLLTKEEVIAFLREQNSRILKNIKQVQDLYLNKGKLLKGQFEEKSELFVDQLVQNEKELQIAQVQYAKEKKAHEQLLQRLKKTRIRVFFKKLWRRKGEPIGQFFADIGTYCFLCCKKGGIMAIHFIEDIQVKERKKREKKLARSVALAFLILAGLFIVSLYMNENTSQAASLTGFAVIDTMGYIKHAESPTAEQLKKEKSITETNREAIEAKKNKTECVSLEQLSQVQIIRQNEITNFTEEDIAKLLASAEDAVGQMKSVGVATLYVEDILEGMEDEAKEKVIDYDSIADDASRVLAAKEDAFYIKDMLLLKEQEIQEFEKATGFNATPAWDLYAKAETGLANAQYDEAKNAIEAITSALDEIQLESTRLTTLLAAQRNRFVEWAKDNLLFFTLFIIFFLWFSVFFYRRLKIFLLKRNIENLSIEQKVLIDLIKRAQREYLVEGKISRNMMFLKTNKYKEEIEEVKAKLPVLKARLQEKLCEQNRSAAERWEETREHLKKYFLRCKERAFIVWDALAKKKDLYSNKKIKEKK